MGSIIAVLTVFSLVGVSTAWATSPLIGQWKFSATRVDPPESQGLTLPPASDDLKLAFEFFDDGTNFLSWTKEEPKLSCQRRAIFVDQGEHIVEIITWANPENSAECSQDPDMEMGRELKTPYKIVDGRLETKLHVGQQSIVFIWEKQTPTH